MAQALASERSLRRIKNGLGLVTTALLINIVFSIIYIILAACLKDPKYDNAMKVIELVVGCFFLVSSIFMIIGNIICIFSGERNYLIALFTYILILIIDIIIACIGGRQDDPSKYATAIMYIIEFIAQFVGTIAIIGALKHANNSVRHPNGFNNLSLGLVGLAYVGMIVTAFVLVFGKFDDNANNIMKIVILVCTVVANVFYTISLFITHRVLKENL